MSSFGRGKIVAQKAPVQFLKKRETPYPELVARVISTGMVKRCCLSAGITRSKCPSLVPVIREPCVKWLKKLKRVSSAHAYASNRVTINTIDTIKSLNIMGMKVYGTGCTGSSNVTSYSGGYLSHCNARRGGRKEKRAAASANKSVAVAENPSVDEVD